ncbi:hypothetical protein [Bradyrhizobium jicamae]|uniref:hypothetical protein n=1 Tax=Bradyrhizobium jicamae TaxID=280332 RepID=UPI001BACA9F5|nr:hypothetical protein [Bradyrhizobium jicamae]MBR0936431.1 hypothetical protein [Bradyrhizobium jicamae]
MRLLPLKDPERSWRNIKAQWKKDAEGVGEEFATFGGNAVIDALTSKEGDSQGLYYLADAARVHALCQVRRMLMSKYPTPALSARFVNVSPIYDLGLAAAGDYAQVLVALFSGVVWLSRDALAASHIRFFLKSPGDSQFFAALKAETPLSPFSRFTIEGALIECSLKDAKAAAS